MFVWCDHAVQKYLDDDEKILVGEEHEVFEAGIDGGFGWRVDVRACMREKVEELDETADCKSFKFLCTQKGLSEVHIFDDLKCDKLCNVHSVGSSRALSQVPPVFA